MRGLLAAAALWLGLLSAPAFAALALDGTPAGQGGSATTNVAATITFTTAQDILVAVIQTEHQTAYSTVTGVTSTSGLTWAKYTRQQASQYSGFGNNPNFDDVEIWWAYSPAAHTSEVVTATFSAAPDGDSMVAMAVKGFTGTGYQTAPWDSNASLPGYNHIDTNTTQAPTISSVPSTSAAGMRIDAVGEGSGATYTGKPTADTAAGNANNSSGAAGSAVVASYQVYASALSGAVTWSTTIAGPYMAVSAALSMTGGGGGGATGSGFPPSGLTTIGVGAP